MFFPRFATGWLILIGCLLSYVAHSQNGSFGQVPLEDLKMTVYPPDSSAEAVVLSDIGKCTLTNTEVRYAAYYERHVRIKILKKSGFDRATVRIPFYRNRSGPSEQIRDIEAITHTVQTDGSIRTDRLAKTDIFEENRSANYYVVRFTMPNVREGSIIEYKYNLTSELLFELRDWQFQQDIPVRWSQYDFNTIPGFEYRILFQGFESLAVDKQQKSGNDMHYRWAMINLPALREEDFMTTPDSYRAKVWFELIRTTLPGQIGPKNFAKSWEDLDRLLLTDEDFGQPLNRGGFLKEIAATLKNQSADTLQQVTAAYQYLSRAMTWNKNRGIWVAKGLKSAFEAKTGNTADLNLMLVALLREMDLEAHPVVLSTKQNGMISKEYPLVTWFNYVVALVRVGGKDLLLDVCEPGLRLGALPERCINGEGRLIHMRKARWVPLVPTEKRRQSGQFALTLTPDGQLEGSVTLSNSGYAALDIRQVLQDVGMEKFRRSIQSSNANWQWTSLNILNADTSYVPVLFKGNVLIPEGASQIDNRLYLRPLPIAELTHNPFKSPERRFPVDTGVPIEKSYVAVYTLPAGYTSKKRPKTSPWPCPATGAGLRS